MGRTLQGDPSLSALPSITTIISVVTSISPQCYDEYREVRVVLSGADKAEALLSGVTRSLSAYDFPVCGVSSAMWMVDEAATSLLKTREGGEAVDVVYH